MIPTSVSICIPTLRRPERLRTLLRSLQTLQYRLQPEPEVTLVVVDSDPQCSARPAVAEYLSRRYRILYRTQHGKGISYARNAALERARSADFVAFIDDDEIASPQWLDELLTVQDNYGAAIVAGPVLPDFETLPPTWLVHHAFFRGRRHKTGTRLTSIGAGNVLIAREVLQSLYPVWFDPRFSKTGGEDTHFFRRCSKLGFPPVWADQAVVYESIPQSRLSHEYLKSRARNGANHWTRVDLELRRRPLYLGTRFAAGIFRLLQGSLATIAGPVLSEARRFRGQLRWAEGIGNLQAFFGRTYDVYGSSES